MSNHWKDYWQEHHHGEKEYCRESGPLNSRKISAAKAKNPIIANGLGLVASTLAAVGLAAAIAALYITSAPVMIGEHSASVNVSVHNRQEGEQIEYVLFKEEAPDTPIDSGMIEPDEEALEFDELESNTSYVIEYFAEREGAREKVGEFRFTTDGPVEEGSSTPPTTDPPPTSTEDDPIPPETTDFVPETTESEEETSEQLEETTTEEETTESEEETSSEEETTQRPTQYQPTPPRPTQPQPTQPQPTQPQPTQPQPTQPSEPETGYTEPETGYTEPDTGVTEPETADPNQEIVASAEVIAVTPRPVDGYFAEGYVCTERHTFMNVSSGEAVITATQNGQDVEYQMYYNSSTLELTIEFDGYEISAGEYGTSLVTIEDVDGRTATSSLTITAPRLNSLELTSRDNGNGTCTFTITGQVTQPSHGRLVYMTGISDGAGGYVEDGFTGTGNTYNHSVTMPVNAVGTLYAYADLYAKWYLDGEDTGSGLLDPSVDQLLYIGAQDEGEYNVGSATLTFENVAGEGFYYAYDAKATFSGLSGVTPVSMKFYLTKGLYADGFMGMGDEILFAEFLDVTLENGSITAQVPMNGDDALYESERHIWRVELTCQDAYGKTYISEVDGYIEPPRIEGLSIEAVMTPSSAGDVAALYDISYTLKTKMNSGIYPGSMIMNLLAYREQGANMPTTIASPLFTANGNVYMSSGQITIPALVVDFTTGGHWSLTSGATLSRDVTAEFYNSSSMYGDMINTEDADGVPNGFDVMEMHMFHNVSKLNYDTGYYQVSVSGEIREEPVVRYEESENDPNVGNLVVEFMRHVGFGENVSSQVDLVFRIGDNKCTSRSILTYISPEE